MSLEHFQLIDDTSIIKGDYTKIYQQGAQMNISNQVIDFFFGENNNYHQIYNGYLEIETTLRINGANFIYNDGDGKVDEPIRLVNKAFAYAFSIATLSATRGEEIEPNKYVWRRFNDETSNK